MIPAIITPWLARDQPAAKPRVPVSIHFSIICGLAFLCPVFAQEPSPLQNGPGQTMPTVTPGDWPQWRGSERDGISREINLLKSWPEGGPPLAWKAQDLGEGISAPSIANRRILGMSYRGNDEVVWALQVNNGETIWCAKIAQANRSVGYPDGSRCTPTVDGTLVYALGVSGDLVCLNAETGQLLWQKNLVKHFGGKVPPWGYSESPLVDGDYVIATPGLAKATLVALHKKTGDTFWQCQVSQGDEADYSSMITSMVEGQRQYIQFLHGGVVGVSAGEGKLLWRFDKPTSNRYNIATPIFLKNQVFAASLSGGALARLVPQDARTNVEEVYFTAKMGNLYGGMVLIDGDLYGEHDGTLGCSEFTTGKLKWLDSRPYANRLRRGSIGYADGRLYYREIQGTMHLLEANPQALVEHGRFEQSDRSAKDAFPPPVIANRRLYLRDQNMLLCFDIADKTRARLRLQSPWLQTDGRLQLCVGSEDETPLSPERIGKIEILTTSDLTLHPSFWSKLIPTLVFTNGVLRLENLGRTPLPHQFFMAIENP